MIINAIWGCEWRFRGLQKGQRRNSEQNYIQMTFELNPKGNLVNRR